MTAKRKLIRRNAHKMIAKIFEDSTTAKVYTLANGFVGESIGVEWVKEHIANISHAEHYDNLNGTYTIRIHSNLWYDLASENKGPDVDDRYTVEVTDDEIIVTPKEPDVTHEQHANTWFAENQELVNSRLAKMALNDARGALGFEVNDRLKQAHARGVNIDEISKLYRALMSAIVDKMHELDENQHDNAHLIGPVYRRKSDCGLCGLPVWAHLYENGDYYLSCACGETSIRKKADFNKENFVFAEKGEI